MSASLDDADQDASFIKKNPIKRERVRVGDPDFESPDGGWAWIILVACGFSNLSAFPVFQQYGLVFKEKFEAQGISATQVVTIINTCIAFNTGAGLLNGPIFKRYTSRKVGLLSSILVVGCLIASARCTNFWTYIIFFSIGYGGSFGLLESANALAMNTYFDKKRRIATGLSWSITAFGPVVCPYIIIALIDWCGMEWTILLFAAFAMHTFACSLTLQPVHWHTKFRNNRDFSTGNILESTRDEKSHPFDNSTYSKIHDCSVINADTPVMLFGSNCSLSSLKDRRRSGCPLPNRNSTLKNLTEHKEELFEHTIDIETNNTLKHSTVNKEQSFWAQIYQDFDFDLLKDPLYINLMVGLTVTNFVELNFGLLTPVILEEFHYETGQIAIYMSLLAGADNVFRFIVSVIADKIPISNKYFYLIGVCTMLIGRAVLVHTYTMTWTLIAAVIIGCGKALRTIFIILVIPSYVPIERLPAAYGLQYAFSLLFFVAGGPIAGFIREAVGDFRTQMHILNFLTYMTVVLWICESKICGLFKR